MAWKILTDYIRVWLNELGDEDYDLIMASFDILAEKGPSLKRPLVGELHSDLFKNLKELRPGSKGKSEIRIIFIFDPKRQAVMLVAGDKNSKNKKERWEDWYNEKIPLAEKIYLNYLNKQEAQNDSRRIKTN